MDPTILIALGILAASVAAIMLSRRRVLLRDLDDTSLARLLDAPSGETVPLEGNVPIVYNLTPAQLDRIRKRRDVQLVDIRQPFEHSAIPVIKGAQSMPLMQLRGRIRELDTDTNTVALCLSGHRSVSAGRTLVRNGFNKVFQLKGGMAAWTQFKGGGTL